MRKHCHRQIRRLAPPMLVARGLVETELELRERMAVEAFAGGYADKEHFDTLADLRNILTIAAAHKDDRTDLAMCDLMREPMAAIRERHHRTGRMGVTGPELAFLREFVTFYGDFWRRQSTALYEVCMAELRQIMADKAGPAMEGEAA